MHAENWNKFPKINPGDKVRITWDDRYYGNQETGTAFLSRKDKGTMMVKFGDKKVTADSLRGNEHIERTEVIPK